MSSRPTLTHSPFPPTAPAHGRDYRITVPGNERMPWNQSISLSRLELEQLAGDVAAALEQPEPGRLC